MKVPIVGPSYQMDAVSFDCQRTVNMFAILSESGTSKDVAALRLCPGYKKYAEAGGGPGRGGITTGRKRGFVVSGFGFYEINKDGTASLLGTLDTSVAWISMAENGDQVMIVDGPNGYIFTQSTNVFAKITDEHFPGGNVVNFCGGYFVVNKPLSPDAYISGLYNGFLWDPLDKTTVSANPGNIVGHITDRGGIWFFKGDSAEVYENTGNADFPFERVPGAIIPTGCEAAHTIKAVDNTLVWLGVDKQGRGVVWKAEGYNAVRISTQAIEKKIAESDEREESYSWVYHQQGHVFYCLQVKGLDTTLVYDFSTKLWHERQYLDRTLNAYKQHRGAAHFFFDNKNLILDRENGNIYELSLDIYDFDGEPQVWTRISPHYELERALIAHNKLELDCEVGRGLQSGQGSDPQIMMRYSNDGGRTWSAEIWRSLGKVGQYLRRVSWHRLGVARDRVYWLSGSDPVFFQMNAAYINGN